MELTNQIILAVVSANAGLILYLIKQVSKNTSSISKILTEIKYIRRDIEYQDRKFRTHLTKLHKIENYLGSRKTSSLV